MKQMRNVKFEMRNGCTLFNYAFHISHFAFEAVRG